MSADADLREPDQLDGVPLPELRMTVIGHEAARAGILAQLDQDRLPTACSSPAAA